MNIGLSKEALRWVAVRAVSKTELTGLFKEQNQPHIPEDVLMAVGMPNEEFNLRKLLMELSLFRVMKDPKFPTIPLGAGAMFIQVATTVSPVAIVANPDFTLMISEVRQPEVKGGLVFARHPLANSLKYRTARDMLLLETSKTLSEVGRSPIPDYRDPANWIS